NVGDGDLVASDSSDSGDEGFVVDEVEEVVQIDEPSAPAEGDADLQMFDKAFDALEIPVQDDRDHPDTMPIMLPPPVDEAMPLTAEAASEAKSGVPAANSDGERSIDDLLGSLDGQPALEPEAAPS